MTTKIFVSLPFSDEDIEIVEIKCMSQNKDSIKKYLSDKLGDDPRFRILPARSEES